VTESSPEIAPVREGEILDGKYRVERVLGVGGMGIVVAATHVQLNTRVALKFLLPAALGNAQIVERFAREARAAVQIQSEHVARVTDVGTLPTGSPYMVMEYLEGGDLADTLAQSGPMPVAQAVGFVLQACEAIAEAHSLGIVHRDLKPANLFLARRTGRDAVVKVLDFGISKTKDSGPSGLTQTSAMMGSPYYMAPEQMMSSKDVDARADIWALGIILYELLAGAPPFVAESMPEIVFMVTQRDPPPLATKRPDLPVALADIVARCLIRDPTQRYANVARLASALAPFGPPRSEISVERIVRVLGASAPPPPEGSGRQVPKQATSSTWASSQPGARTQSKARAAILVGALVALFGVGVGWRLLRSPAQPARSEEPPTTAAAPPTASAPEASAAPTVAPVPAPPALTAILAPAPVTSEPLPVKSAKPAVATPVAVARPTPAKPKPAPAPVESAAEPRPAQNRGLNMGMKE
jgi:eukaryotic-like serine/threonine-protein kinase